MSRVECGLLYSRALFVFSCVCFGFGLLCLAHEIKKKTLFLRRQYSSLKIARTWRICSHNATVAAESSMVVIGQDCRHCEHLQCKKGHIFLLWCDFLDTYLWVMRVCMGYRQVPHALIASRRLYADVSWHKRERTSLGRVRLTFFKTWNVERLYWRSKVTVCTFFSRWIVAGTAVAFMTVRELKFVFYEGRQESDWQGF